MKKQSLVLFMTMAAFAAGAKAQTSTNTTSTATKSTNVQAVQPTLSAPVTVVNTSANPVPVVGAISINGTSTVSAQQSGDWNVGIAGNSATNPLQVHDVDHAQRTPYAQTKNLTFNGPDRAVLGN